MNNSDSKYEKYNKKKKEKINKGDLNRVQVYFNKKDYKQLESWKERLGFNNWRDTINGLMELASCPSYIIESGDPIPKVTISKEELLRHKKLAHSLSLLNTLSKLRESVSLDKEEGHYYRARKRLEAFLERLDSLTLPSLDWMFVLDEYSHFYSSFDDDTDSSIDFNKEQSVPDRFVRYKYTRPNDKVNNPSKYKSPNQLKYDDCYIEWHDFNNDTLLHEYLDKLLIETNGTNYYPHISIERILELIYSNSIEKYLLSCEEDMKITRLYKLLKREVDSKIKLKEEIKTLRKKTKQLQP